MEQLQVEPNARWEAVVACDAAYDGTFYYAVMTTGIFCRPSCRARTPRKEHVSYYDCREDAMREGYRPCKRCRPDLLVYDPDRELVERVKRWLAEHVQEPLAMDRLEREIGVSRNHLLRLFSKNEGRSPKAHMTKLRIQRAAVLLRETSMSILQIALACGFVSLSHFYASFKQEYDVAPRVYRLREKGGA